ncbi:MAG: hypothetical protein N3B16_10745 [Candidatus Aminicenantes bacterium]|nr:hypothetical protein [Candidatus Aminicenantes bacterium]
MAEARGKEIRLVLPEELFNLFLPEETQKHLLKAKKEILLAFRSLIDAKIEALEKREEKLTEEKKKKIEVE